MKHSENIKPDEIHTTAVFHKAEPGVDIFAAEVEKDGKSSSYMQPKPGEKKEEKVISSVGVDAFPKDDSNAFVFQESKPIVISTKSSSATELTSTVSVAISESVVVKKPKAQAGPLGEAEVEAQKAAEELFPDQ